MTLIRTIMGVMAGLMLALPATAQTSDIRPLSRADAISAKLASVRPAARPLHMIRYPVEIETRAPDVRPVARAPFLPRARWDFKRGGRVWTRAAMSAVAAHAEVLTSVVPRDIDRWCPAYAAHGPEQRRAFWVGMMSALAKHESTYRPTAVGGGDLWYGLLQIYPDTARRYGCRARTGDALKNPAENLSCAARIMAVTVPRDNAVAIYDRRWRGVAADWGPMTKRAKIAEMSAWTSAQSYCQPLETIRPIARPATPVVVSTMTATPPQD
ncbi:transglycosylase SLT domain-containing protein [Yoonia sp. SS1-5]|uniref:Transglycosylase SLT domain-containing protein n=1 Tax=Yoonia rhodophyticola TaxID=3137370 RepID=A0AAN0M8D3_9RHOB